MTSSPNIKIVVASHKPYWMPSDPMYVPVQVGATGRESIPGFQRDDEGDNISEKNPRYCELTALYWAWKNLDADYIGLAHYRRHFAGSGERGVLTCDDARRLVSMASVVVPKKRHYVIETVGDHYAHTFDGAHLDAVRDSLRQLTPGILPAFEAHMGSRSAHIWNMCIMRREVLDAWCSWLFPVLAQVENEIDFEGMTPFEERVVGRLSERLLDPWMRATQIAPLEVGCSSMESVEWGRKCASFLAAKFFGKRYHSSF